MTTPPMILWEEAGEPVDFISGNVHEDGQYRCAVCGAEVGRAVTLEDTFTGNEDGWPRFHDQTSEWVCLGCDFASKGRWKDQFRLWSILWCEDGGLPDHQGSVYEHIDEATYPVRLEPVVDHGGDRVQITICTPHSKSDAAGG